MICSYLGRNLAFGNSQLQLQIIEIKIKLRLRLKFREKVYGSMISLVYILGLFALVLDVFGQLLCSFLWIFRLAYTILVIRVGRDYLVHYPYNEYKIRAKYSLQFFCCESDRYQILLRPI